MKKNIFDSKAHTESELIYSCLDRPAPSGINDVNGKQIDLGDKLRLTFNKGTFSEHKAVFEVIWKDAGYKIVSEIGKESYLGNISHSVEVEIIE